MAKTVQVGNRECVQHTIHLDKYNSFNMAIPLTMTVSDLQGLLTKAKRVASVAGDAPSTFVLEETKATKGTAKQQKALALMSKYHGVKGVDRDKLAKEIGYSSWSSMTTCVRNKK